MMTLYDYNRLHNKGSSHNRVSESSLYRNIFSFTHTTTGDDSLFLSSYLLSVTPFLVAVLRVCCWCSLHLSRDLGPNQVTFGGSSGHPPGHSIQIHKNRLLIWTIYRSYGDTSWCDLQDTIRPVGEGKLACFPFSLLGHENHHMITNPEFRWAPLPVIL